jgi:hypothetical protein
MSVRYFLQLDGGKEAAWEEVDDFLFDNWKFAVTDSEKKRYNGNRVRLEEGRISLQTESDLFALDVARIARFCGFGGQPLETGRGFVISPEFVMLRRNRQTLLRKTHGSPFVAKEKAAKTEAEPEEAVNSGF